MNGTTGSSGIEVHGGVSAAMKRGAKFFHALHMDRFGKAAAQGTILVIQLDGVEVRRESVLVGHFVACAPGEHQLTVGFHGYGSVVPAMDEATSGRTIAVHVEPGMVTHVEYTPSSYVTATLTVLGTRPAGESLRAGANVVVAWSDGNPYAGQVLQVFGDRTLVQFAGGQQRWVPTAAVRPG